MDLALENRIDTDPEHLILVDATPLADDLLDPTLADIAQDTGARDLGYWVAQTAKQGDEIRDKALARLVNRGILEAESEGIFSLSRLVSRSRRYPAIDGQRVEEVRLRIMRVLFTDEIPDPRDIVIICLADASGVFKNILSQSELSEVQERIDLIRKMDLIGQSVTRAIREYEPPAPVPAPRKEITPGTGVAACWQHHRHDARFALASRQTIPKLRSDFSHQGIQSPLRRPRRSRGEYLRKARG